MAIKLQGYVFKNDGTALSGATVQVYDTSDSSTEGTAVNTDSNGLWTYADISTDALYDVKISSGGSVRWRMGEDKIQIKEAYIRNDTAATQSPLYVANATDAASVKVLDLSNKRVTANVADNDEIYMSFNMQDSAGNADEFARITAIATDVTNDTEDGALVFYVADSDNNGNLQEGFRITSTTGGTVSATTTSASQFNNTITVGVDDTGYDVKFFGATASAYMLWDESEDDLILGGAARLVVPDGQLVLGSTAVSSTPAELNLMDGGSSIGTTTVADGHGIVMNHGGTMAQTTVQTLAAYLDDEITAMPNMTTLTGLTAAGSVSNALALTYSDVTLFHDANNADTSFSIGTSATEALKIEVLNGSSNKTAEEVHFSTATASGTANHGAMVFDVDGTDILTINDGGLTMGSTAFVNTSGVIQVASQTNIAGVGALNAGSITSGFGNINNGSSTITTTGAVGTGALTVGGVVDITDTTDSSDASGDTGALRTEGGASIAKKLYVGTDLDVDGTAELDNITIGGAQGSDGQVLTSTGSGVAWESVSSGVSEDDVVALIVALS